MLARTSAIAVFGALALATGCGGRVRMGDAPADPLAVARSYYEAIALGEPGRARALAPADEATRRLIDAKCALSRAILRVEEATNATFGSDGRDGVLLAFDGADIYRGGFETLSLKFGGAAVIDGDVARIETTDDPGDEEEICRLRRVDGRWKVEVYPTSPPPRPEDVDRELEVVRAQAEEVRLIGEAVAAGRYAGAREARKALIAALQKPQTERAGLPAGADPRPGGSAAKGRE